MRAANSKQALDFARGLRAFQLLTVLGLFQVAACGGPTAPSPQPPALTCPSPIDVEATQPAGAPAVFSLPIPREGRPPYVVECSPASGSLFPLGKTRVDCTANDADLRQTSCSFDVDVRVSQTLRKTRFLAFGDSITAGTESPAALLLVEDPGSYPFELQEFLRQAYPAQEIVILNDGKGGEKLSEGVVRLPGELAAHQPEVLLLLEGIISVRNIPTATNGRHLRTMVAAARQQGIDVIMATVMPVGAGLEAKEPGINAAVVALNLEIGRIAQEFGLGPPVDLYGLFHSQPGLIGRDNLHPTAEGFTRMAELFRDAIVSRYHSGTS